MQQTKQLPFSCQLMNVQPEKILLNGTADFTLTVTKLLKWDSRSPSRIHQY